MMNFINICTTINLKICSDNSTDLEGNNKLSK
jgi:hypothetical protein